MNLFLSSIHFPEDSGTEVPCEAPSPCIRDTAPQLHHGGRGICAEWISEPVPCRAQRQGSVHGGSVPTGLDT